MPSNRIICSANSCVKSSAPRLEFYDRPSVRVTLVAYRRDDRKVKGRPDNTALITGNRRPSVPRDCERELRNRPPILLAFTSRAAFSSICPAVATHIVATMTHNDDEMTYFTAIYTGYR